jgi:hypothetical protein
VVVHHPRDPGPQGVRHRRRSWSTSPRRRRRGPPRRPRRQTQPDHDTKRQQPAHVSHPRFGRPRQTSDGIRGSRRNPPKTTTIGRTTGRVKPPGDGWWGVHAHSLRVRVTSGSPRS